MRSMRPRMRRIALGGLTLLMAVLLGGAIESADATLLLLKPNPADPATFVGHELPSKYLKAHLGKQARARRRAELAGS